MEGRIEMSESPVGAAALAPGENPNELQLTAEDCVFLLGVGIKP